VDSEERMRRLHHWRSAVLAAGFALAVLVIAWTAFADGGGEDTDLRRELAQRVIWSSVEQQRPLFIPADLLNSLPLQELPLNETDRGALERRLEYQRHPELYPKQIPSGRLAECRERASSGGQGSAPQAKGFAELMTDTDVAFVGTIERVEAGFDPRLVAVVEMAFVRVDEVIHRANEITSVVPKAVVAIRLEGGRIEIEGTVLCDEVPEGFDRPKVGDRVLAAGWIGPGDPRFLEGAYVFPLDGDSIRVQPYAFLEEDADPGVLRTLSVRMKQAARDGSGEGP
jgi:hypothetical protein